MHCWIWIFCMTDKNAVNVHKTAQYVDLKQLLQLHKRNRLQWCHFKSRIKYNYQYSILPCKQLHLHNWTQLRHWHTATTQTKQFVLVCSYTDQQTNSTLWSSQDWPPINVLIKVIDLRTVNKHDTDSHRQSQYPFPRQIRTKPKWHIKSIPHLC